MIEKGISRLGRPVNDVQVAIENVGNIEVAKLEKGLTVMATISGGAPMLGFLGTVTGMVRAFYEMANAGSGNIDITLLSGGIYRTTVINGRFYLPTMDIIFNLLHKHRIFFTGFPNHIVTFEQNVETDNRQYGQYNHNPSTLDSHIKHIHFCRCRLLLKMWEI